MLTLCLNNRVRQATSEFKEFAIVWWTGLSFESELPTTWEQLKIAMRDRFVPPSFYTEIRNKLQRLEQGNKTVQEYFGELQKGLIRCAIVEKVEDQLCHFYTGLRKEIRDILDYKEFYTVNQCFQYAMLAEKELQGRAEAYRNYGRTSYPSRATGASGLPKPPFRTPPPAATSKHTTSGAAAASAQKSAPPSTSVQAPASSASSVASTGRTTTGIQCHRCHGLGHIAKNCPSQRAYVATEDGGYMSTSDVEDEEGDVAPNTGDLVLGGGDTTGYLNIIVQHVLSTQVQQAETIQRHNLFQIFFIIKNRRARVIIDGGSCNNLVSSDLVAKLDLPTCPHPHPTIFNG